MAKNKNIEFKGLPIKLQHALEILVEWHSVLVYEIKRGKYGFYILNKYELNALPKLINTNFEGKRYKCFLKGTLPLGSLQIEVITLCKFEEGFGFSIEIHDSDYGFLNKNDAPAYVHVLDENELEIGLLNITGPCPKRISEIKEFRPPHEIGDPNPMKKTSLMKYRKNLVKWANAIHIEGNHWEWAQESWTMFHEYKR
jgi:hypothetical protein